MRSHSLLLSLLALAASASAQTFAHNKLEFGNWWITDREDAFPNFAAAGGNVDGDGLFKVFPTEVLERGEPHRISGYELALSIDDGYSGAYPVDVEVPAVQFYRTRLATIAGNVYEVPDLTQPVGPRFDPIPITIPTDAAWVVEVRFDPRNTNPRTRALLDVPPTNPANPAARGLAMVALARPGDRRAASVPGVVLQSTFGERHLAPGRAAYSGSIDGRTGAMAMFGTTGMPSATGELYFGLRFHNPTLQLAGPSAGGVSPDPLGFETQLGVGAYATDLATRSPPGSVRLYVQAEQFDPGTAASTHLALPFVVALGPAGPTTTVALGSASLRLDPLGLDLATIFVSGHAGALRRIQAASGAGFDQDQLGAFSSAPFPIAPSRSLRGAALWIQALVVAVPSLQPVATTNAVRLVL